MFQIENFDKKNKSMVFCTGRVELPYLAGRGALLARGLRGSY